VVFGWVVGEVVLPAAPEDVKPDAGKDADGVGERPCRTPIRPRLAPATRVLEAGRCAYEATCAITTSAAPKTRKPELSVPLSGGGRLFYVRGHYAGPQSSSRG
jgi:hypothetical protein